MFSEWRVSEVRTCFLAETMAQVLPAAFSLLLALPVRHLSISLWAETHGTSCSKQHPQAKVHFLRPGSSASHRPYSQDMRYQPTSHWNSTGTHQRENLQSVQHAVAKSHFLIVHTQNGLAAIFALPSCTESEWQRKHLWKHVCVVLMMGQGRGDFYLS